MDTSVAPVGLTLLSDPDDAVIDIVFVHGLQGHPQGTWSKRASKSKSTRQNLRVPSKASKPNTNRAHRPLSLFLTRERSNHENPVRGEDSRDGEEEKENKNESDQDVFWPRDLLKPDIPRARIMTFGYDTKITRGYKATNQGNIFSHAGDMLYALEATRRQAPDRDLIFIAHSLGGILVKEVLRRSEVDPDPSITKIFGATTGVFFFGTPHRGSEGWASFGEGVFGIASRMFGVDVNSQAIHALLPTSPELNLCRESFTTQWMSRGEKLTVRTFQESKGVTGIRVGGLNQLIVPPDSSSLDHPGQRARTIDADHREMVRFSSVHDKAYNMVREDIVELVASAEKRERKQQEPNVVPKLDLMSPLMLPAITDRPEWRILLSRSKIPPDGLFERLSDYDYQRAYRWRTRRKLKETTEWILKRPEFLNWLKGEDSQCLWLSGIVGCGKSIVMTTVLEATVEKSNCFGRPVLHFIYDHSFRQHLTAAALFESYIKQLLVYLEGSNKVCPSSIIARLLEFYGPNRPRPDAQELVVEVLKPLYGTIKDIGAVFLVDGVDECSPQEVPEILKGLRQLLWSPSCQVFISCREEVNVSRGIPGAARIWITTEDTKADLEIFVDKEIEENQFVRQISNSEVVLNRIRNELIDMADGMFLWVHYQIKFLWQDCTGESSSDQVVYEALKKLPKDLNETYQQCLKRVNQDAKRKTLADRILRWICVSPEPFKILQLQEALAVNEKSGELENGPVNKEEVMTCCANLAFLEKDGSDELVLLSHHSVRQFLFLPEAASAQLVTSAQAELGQLCVVHLYRHRPRNQLSQHGKSPSARIGMTLPTTSFASTLTNMIGSTVGPAIFRSRMVSSRSQPQTSFPAQFPAPTSRNITFTENGAFLSYAKKSWMLLTTKLDSEYHCWSKFEYLAVSCHTWDVFPWQQQSYRSFDWYIFALYGWSILNGHYPLLKLAVEQRSSVKIDIFNLPLFNHVGSSSALPMSVAAGVGNIRVFELLWETLNSSEPIDNLLQVACAKGHVEIVQVLVNHGADRNAALRQGSHQIIQYLLDTGSQVDRSIGTFTRPNHDYVYRLAFSPDGKVLAMASNRNGTFLDVATMKERHLSLDYAGSSVAFSPDSALVATISFISNDSIGLWNATTGRNLGVLYVHNSKINDIVFSPDYKLLASGSKDGTVRFWDISVFAPGTTSNVPKKSPTLLRTFSNHTDRVMVVAFSPTGNLFASYSGDGMVRFWDTNSMMEAGYELWCPVLARDHFTRPALMFSSDGKQLLSASSYGLVKLWDVATGDGRLLLNDDADNIRAVAFSPDCKLVATGYVDGKIRLLDVASGQMRRVLECHTGRVFSIAFAPDGKLASVSADGTVRFWLTC